MGNNKEVLNKLLDMFRKPCSDYTNNDLRGTVISEAGRDTLREIELIDENGRRIKKIVNVLKK
jgi:hypothetical protein